MSLPVDLSEGAGVGRLIIDVAPDDHATVK